MLVLDRVLCDCCGNDMGRLLGGEVTRPGLIVDKSQAPHFAVCPDCDVDFSQYLGVRTSQEAA